MLSFHPILLPLIFISFLFIAKTIALTVAPIKHSTPINANIKITHAIIRHVIIRVTTTLNPPIFSSPTMFQKSLFPPTTCQWRQAFFGNYLFFKYKIIPTTKEIIPANTKIPPKIINIINNILILNLFASLQFLTNILV